MQQSIYISWVLAALCLVLAGLAWPLGRLYRSRLAKFFPEHIAYGLSLVIQYLWLGGFLILALHQLGLELGMLLGAAGVLTLAVSFAAQNTVSCVISGLFLWFEAPFKLGNIVKIGSHQGRVEGIGLMATQLRRHDGILVRLPNASVYKSDLLNYSHFKERRIALHVTTNREGYQYLSEHLPALVKHISKIKSAKSFMMLKEINKEQVRVICYFWVAAISDDITLSKIFATIDQAFQDEALQRLCPIDSLRMGLDG